MINMKDEIKEKLSEAINKFEHALSQAKFAVKDNLNLFEPIKIMPYYGFGNETYIFLKGRVLEDEKVKEKKEGSSKFEHLKNTYKRYESDEIPHIKVKASFAGEEIITKTDREGFFEIEFHFENSIDYKKHGQKVNLKLLESKTDKDELEVWAKIFISPENAEFGIISDIDDTVLVSKVTHFLAKLKLMLLDDASERSPFLGIAAFLRALSKGSDAKGKNPLFYVSGSEWNLFDLLIHFFKFHNIPVGPLLLRDKGIGTEKGKNETGEKEYKQEKIRHILQTYPHLKFICIGDSGQEDPGIYQKIQQQFPEQILGVYIRDVSKDKRDKEVQKIAEEVKEAGAEMLLVSDTLAAAKHALKMNWINQSQLYDIEQECKKDIEN